MFLTQLYYRQVHNIYNLNGISFDTNLDYSWVKCLHQFSEFLLIILSQQYAGFIFMFLFNKYSIIFHSGLWLLYYYYYTSKYTTFIILMEFFLLARIYKLKRILIQILRNIFTQFSYNTSIGKKILIFGSKKKNKIRSSFVQIT